MNARQRSDFAANPQTIPFDEWWKLWHYVTALEARDNSSCRLWLEVGGGRRVWHVSTSRFRFEYTAAASEVKGSFVVPFAARFVFAVTDVLTSTTDLTLSLGEGDSLVFSGGDVTLAYDVPDFEPSQTLALGAVECTVVVSGDRLADIVDVARTPPVGVDIVGYGPPIWCVVGDGRLAFHSDWTSYGHGRSTVSLEATTTGTTQFHSGISVVGRLLRDFSVNELDDDTVTFHIDGAEGVGCRVMARDWVLTCPFLDPVGLEWGWPMRRELARAGFDTVDDGERAAEFFVNGSQIRAEVHGGSYPICRMSTTVARNIECSDFLLGELNDWNKAHAGIKFWWENGKVAAIVDLSCAHLDDLAAEASRLASVASRLAPATSAL